MKDGAGQHDREGNIQRKFVGDIHAACSAWGWEEQDLHSSAILLEERISETPSRRSFNVVVLDADENSIELVSSFWHRWHKTLDITCEISSPLSWSGFSHSGSTPWVQRMFLRIMAAWLHSHRGQDSFLWQHLFFVLRRQSGGTAALRERSYSLAVNPACPRGLPVAGLPNAAVPARYLVTLTAEIVSKLSQQGQVSEAVEALGGLVQRGHRVSRSLFWAVLKQCVVHKDLILGRRIHALTVKKGFEGDTFLCNHILRMYACHGRLPEAMAVFSGVAKPDAFLWSSIISAHAKHGQARQALELYCEMSRSSVKPDGHVFVAALQACAREADLKNGQKVHADLLDSGVEPDLFVCSGLVDMYAKCGSLKDAQNVFDRLPRKDVVTWTAMIRGYSQQGMSQEALSLYSAMQDECVAAPDSVTFVCLLQACASVGTTALERGKQLHAQIARRGLQADVFVVNSLINMYAKCGSLEDAQGVFDGLVQKDVVTWTALIAGYSQKGMAQEALHLYSVMREEGVVPPDSVTFACLLQACASVGTRGLEQGKQLHAEIEGKGLQADVVVANSLVNMYAKCGSVEYAQSIFDGLRQKDGVTWNAMIAGYSQQGRGREALCIYSALREEGGTTPDSVTFVCVLQACASLGTAALDRGKQVHAEIEEQGLQADVSVANSLVNMYTKCGSLEDAQKVFDGLGKKDVVTWNAMITGYSQEAKAQEALRLYSAMRNEGAATPDSVTFVCLLQACANVAALVPGRQLHSEIEEQGLQADIFVAISLINMYAKSGSMVEAQDVFNALPKKDIVAWNALIAGYTRQGNSEMVFDLVGRMREEGMLPDGITFLSILTVCSHAGLVTQGQEYFEAMRGQDGMNPTAEHYSCIVDLLGRAGQLEEALALMRSMPVQPNSAVWRTLLAGCLKWSNVEVGRRAFEEAVKLDDKDSAPYVLMSNIFTGAQMWEQAEEMQTRRKAVGAWKQPGQSWWTGMDGLVHSFVVGDSKHLDSDGIYAKLEHLLPQLRKQGYLPHVLQTVI